MTVGSVGSSNSYLYQMSGTQSRPSPKEMFEKDDANGDGGLDVSELSAMTEKISEMTGQTIDAQALMDTYDADGDGVLSFEESQSAMASLGGSMGAPPPPPSPEEMFAQDDADGDGALDLTEFTAVTDKISEMTGQSVDAEELFSTYDTDGDGKLSFEETEAAMEALRESTEQTQTGTAAAQGIEQYAAVASLATTQASVSTLTDLLTASNKEEEDASTSILRVDTIV